MMNTRPQTTRVEVRIRMPAWRRDSLKNRNTRPPNTLATTRAANFARSPVVASHPRGTASKLSMLARMRQDPLPGQSHGTWVSSRGIRTFWGIARSANAYNRRVAIAPNTRLAELAAAMRDDAANIALRMAERLGQDVPEWLTRYPDLAKRGFEMTRGSVEAQFAALAEGGEMPD